MPLNHYPLNIMTVKGLKKIRSRTNHYYRGCMYVSVIACVIAVGHVIPIDIFDFKGSSYCTYQSTNGKLLVQI